MMPRATRTSYKADTRYIELEPVRTPNHNQHTSSQYVQGTARAPYCSPVSEGRTPVATTQNHYDYYGTVLSLREDMDGDINEDYDDDYDGDETGRRGKGVKWSNEEDLLLEELRRRRGRWCEVAKQFKGKSANACRKRYERIQQRKTITDKSAAEDRQRVAVAYWETREEIWRILESRMPGMKWEKLERMCFEMGEVDLKKRWRDAKNRVSDESYITSSQVPLSGPSSNLGMGSVYPPASSAVMQSIMASEPSSYAQADSLVSQPSLTSSALSYTPIISHSHGAATFYNSNMHDSQTQSQAYSTDMLAAGHMSGSYMTHTSVGDMHYGHHQRMSTADMGISALINRPVNM